LTADDCIAIGIAGNDHARHGRLQFHDICEKLDSVHRRHAVVTDYEIEILVVAALDCGFGQGKHLEVKRFSVEQADIDRR